MERSKKEDVYLISKLNDSLDPNSSLVRGIQQSNPGKIP